MKRKRNEKGFTIAELLIVVAIIAVLVAIAIPTFSNSVESAREGVDLSNLRSAYSSARIGEMLGVIDGERLTSGIQVFYYEPDTGNLLSGPNARVKFGGGSGTITNGYMQAQREEGPIISYDIQEAEILDYSDVWENLSVPDEMIVRARFRDQKLIEVTFCDYIYLNSDY